MLERRRRMKFRKRSIVMEIDPIQWFKFGDHPDVEKDTFSHQGGRSCDECHHDIDIHGTIKTLEGKHIVCPGDWIITGIKGEKYPCKPDIFEATYEKIGEPE